MGIILDIIAIGIILFSALIAYYRGFVKTFFGFLSVVLAIVLACFFAKPLGSQIKESTEMDEWIIESIVSIGKIDESKEYTILSGEDISGEILIEKDNSQETEKLSKEAVTELINDLPETIGGIIDIDDLKENTLNTIAVKVSDTVINVFAWILIYFVVKVVFAVVTVVFHGIMSIPILKSINNLAGLGLGGIIGVFRVYLILAIIYFITSVTGITAIVNFIQSSTFVNAMYNSNLIIKLIF